MSASVAQLLVAWYRAGHRDLPWRRTQDPYSILVSEIMLQQTRAQAVIPYYERFLGTFPTLESLAAAAEEQVLTQWSGLGYYSRARNLRKAAQFLVTAGGFPKRFEELLRLPGVGDYTAAAVASIAFGERHAVLDGNVLRVVARMLNDAADIGSSTTRTRFRVVAQEWLDPKDPGLFNQALMELGATVCLPKTPLCTACPLAGACQARSQGTAAGLPVKLRKTVPVVLEEVLLVVENRGLVLMRQRDAQARRMAGFWDLPAPEDLPAAELGRHFGEFRHTITHHHYTFSVHAARAGKRRREGHVFRWMRPAELSHIPLSTTARKALQLADIL